MKMPIRARRVLAILLLLLPMAVSAATEEELLLFGDTVSTPSRRPQPVSESPVPVTVLTREDIRRSGAKTLPEVLELAVGVNVLRHSEAGADVSIRGFNGIGSDKVLVMLDGRPLFNLADSSIDWRLLPVPIEAIERVEIVRGPGSALYGENALLGAINIITSREGDGGYTSGWSGFEGSGGANVTVGGPSFIAATTRQYFNRFGSGSNHDIPNYILQTHDADPSTARVVIQSHYFSAPLNASHTALFSAGLTQVESSYRGNDTVDRMGFAAADYAARMDGVDWQLGFRLLGQDRALQDTHSWPGPYQHFVRADADIRGIYATGVNNVIVGGFTASVRSLTDQVYLDGANDSIGGNVVSIFFEDQLSLADKTVFITTGGRIDVYSDMPALFSPRLGIIYSPSQHHSFKAGWGMASRTPGYYDLHGISTAEPFYVFSGNDNLRPEHITSYNLNYLYQNPGWVSIAVDLYYQELKDLIVYELYSYSPTARVFRLKNEDRATSMGLELEGRFRLTGRVELLANYAWNDANYSYDGHLLDAPYSPLHQANMALFFSDPRFNFSIWGHYVGRQIGVTYDAPFVERVLINDYATVAARLEWVIIPDGLSIAVYDSDILGGGHYEAPVWAPVRPWCYVELTLGPDLP